MRLSATGPTHTFESHNAISTLDYIAVPTIIEDKIGECWVSDRHYLNSSDHLPVNLNLYISDVKLVLGGSEVPARIRWDKLTYLDIERKFTSKLKPWIAGILRHLRSFEANPVILDECFRELTQALCKVSRDCRIQNSRKI